MKKRSIFPSVVSSSFGRHVFVLLLGAFATIHPSRAPAGDDSVGSIVVQLRERHSAYAERLAGIVTPEMRQAWLEYQQSLPQLSGLISELRRQPENEDTQKRVITEFSKSLLALHTTAEGAIRAYPEIKQAGESHAQSITEIRTALQGKRADYVTDHAAGEKHRAKLDSELNALAEELRAPLEANEALPPEITRRVETLNSRLQAQERQIAMLAAAIRAEDKNLTKLNNELDRVEEALLTQDANFQKLGGVVQEIKVTSDILSSWGTTIDVASATSKLVNLIQVLGEQSPEGGEIIRFVTAIVGSGAPESVNRPGGEAVENMLRARLRHPSSAPQP